jgi:hypothetical protein
MTYTQSNLASDASTLAQRLILETPLVYSRAISDGMILPSLTPYMKEYIPQPEDQLRLGNSPLMVIPVSETMLNYACLHLPYKSNGSAWGMRSLDKTQWTMLYREFLGNEEFVFAIDAGTPLNNQAIRDWCKQGHIPTMLCNPPSGLSLYIELPIKFVPGTMAYLDDAANLFAPPSLEHLYSFWASAECIMDSFDSDGNAHRSYVSDINSVILACTTPMEATADMPFYA